MSPLAQARLQEQRRAPVARSPPLSHGEDDSVVGPNGRKLGGPTVGDESLSQGSPTLSRPGALSDTEKSAILARAAATEEQRRREQEEAATRIEALARGVIARTHRFDEGSEGVERSMEWQDEASRVREHELDAASRTARNAEQFEKDSRSARHQIASVRVGAPTTLDAESVPSSPTARERQRTAGFPSPKTAEDLDPSSAAPTMSQVNSWLIEAVRSKNAAARVAEAMQRSEEAQREASALRGLTPHRDASEEEKARLRTAQMAADARVAATTKELAQAGREAQAEAMRVQGMQAQDPSSSVRTVGSDDSERAPLARSESFTEAEAAADLALHAALEAARASGDHEAEARASEQLSARESAATAIQAVMRGHLARSDMKKPAGIAQEFERLRRQASEEARRAREEAASAREAMERERHAREQVAAEAKALRAKLEEAQAVTEGELLRAEARIAAERDAAARAVKMLEHVHHDREAAQSEAASQLAEAEKRMQELEAEAERQRESARLAEAARAVALQESKDREEAIQREMREEAEARRRKLEEDANRSRESMEQALRAAEQAREDAEAARIAEQATAQAALEAERQRLLAESEARKREMESLLKAARDDAERTRAELARQAREAEERVAEMERKQQGERRHIEMVAAEQLSRLEQGYVDLISNAEAAKEEAEQELQVARRENLLMNAELEENREGFHMAEEMRARWKEAEKQKARVEGALREVRHRLEDTQAALEITAPRALLADRPTPGLLTNGSPEQATQTALSIGRLLSSVRPVGGVQTPFGVVGRGAQHGVSNPAFYSPPPPPSSSPPSSSSLSQRQPSEPTGLLTSGGPVSPPEAVSSTQSRRKKTLDQLSIPRDSASVAPSVATPLASLSAESFDEAVKAAVMDSVNRLLLQKRISSDISAEEREALERAATSAVTAARGAASDKRAAPQPPPKAVAPPKQASDAFASLVRTKVLAGKTKQRQFSLNPAALQRKSVYDASPSPRTREDEQAKKQELRVRAPWLAVSAPGVGASGKPLTSHMSSLSEASDADIAERELRKQQNIEAAASRMSRKRMSAVETRQTSLKGALRTANEDATVVAAATVAAKSALGAYKHAGLRPLEEVEEVEEEGSVTSGRVRHSTSRTAPPPPIRPSQDLPPDVEAEIQRRVDAAVRSAGGAQGVMRDTGTPQVARDAAEMARDLSHKRRMTASPKVSPRPSPLTRKDSRTERRMTMMMQAGASNRSMGGGGYIALKEELTEQARTARESSLQGGHPVASPRVVRSPSDRGSPRAMSRASMRSRASSDGRTSGHQLFDEVLGSAGGSDVTRLQFELEQTRRELARERHLTHEAETGTGHTPSSQGEVYSFHEDEVEEDVDEETLMAQIMELERLALVGGSA
jgi:hypothetical protein